jgi:hypothetical protein
VPVINEAANEAELDAAWQTAVSSVELPTPDAEIWRYSRISELDPSAFHPVAHAPSVDGPADVLAAHVTVGGDAVDLFGDAPDVFAELNRGVGCRPAPWSRHRS